jgi:hypothetical protein
MHPIVVITENQATDAVHGLKRTEFSITKTHPGNSKKVNRFEAVVVVCED